MRILDKTPLTEMKHHTILDKMREFYQDLASELGVTEEAIDTELSRYAAMSSRCQFDKDEVDFPLADFRGTADQIRTSFMEYTQTKCIKQVESALLGIIRADRPLVDPAFAPEPPPETEKN